MRKIMFMAAIVAVGLSSCSTNQVTDKVRNNEIGFSNLNDRITRAANDDGDNYKVYADSANASTWYIAGEEYDNANESVNDKSYFWPKQELTFYAYAPAAAGTVSATHPVLTVEYTVPANADEDFTVATPKAQSSGTVNFEFKHMLSKVSFKVALAQNLKDAGYTIENSGTATFDVKTSKATVDLTAASPVFGTADTDPEAYAGANSYMIMPQSSTDCTIQIKGIVLKHGESEHFSGDLKTYTIAAGQIDGGSEFAKNKHYAITLTLTGTSTDGNNDPVFDSEIKFDADLAPWEEGSSDLTQP